MSKQELAELVYCNTGINRRRAKKCVELILTEIKDCIRNRENVHIKHFGTFKPRVWRARRSGLPSVDEAKRDKRNKITVKFKPAKQLKESVNVDERGRKCDPMAEASLLSATIALIHTDENKE